ADQAVGRLAAVSLRKELVEGVDERLVASVLANTTPDGLVGVVEDLGVHPVLVLLAHPLVRPAGARVVVVGLTDDVALIVWLAAHGQTEDVRVAALHDDAVA